jgi:hypothetical protein
MCPLSLLMARMASSCEANSTSASPEALPVWSCSRRTLIGTIGLKNCNKTSDGDCERRALPHVSNIRCRGLEREPPHVDAVQVPRVPVARLVGLPPRVDLVRGCAPLLSTRSRCGCSRSSWTTICRSLL